MLLFSISIALIIWIALGFGKGGDIQTTYRQIVLSIFLVGICLPIAFFIGAMATDSGVNITLKFWQGFLFIEGVPLLCLLLSLIKLVKQHFGK
ncbi:hypothetical protein BC2903_53930 [Bacillus cereus]|nr:hypothetical protein BC2903_53930 [Bacillus cereus]